MRFCPRAPTPAVPAVWRAALLLRVMDVHPSAALMLWDEKPTMHADEIAAMRYVTVTRRLIIVPGYCCDRSIYPAAMIGLVVRSQQLFWGLFDRSSSIGRSDG